MKPERAVLASLLTTANDVRLIADYHLLIPTNDIESGYLMRRKSIGNTEWLMGGPEQYSVYSVWRMVIPGDISFTIPRIAAFLELMTSKVSLVHKCNFA